MTINIITLSDSAFIPVDNIFCSFLHSFCYFMLPKLQKIIRLEWLIFLILKLWPVTQVDKLGIIKPKKISVLHFSYRHLNSPSINCILMSKINLSSKCWLSEVWNDMMVSKWRQIFIFGWTIPLMTQTGGNYTLTLIMFSQVQVWINMTWNVK